MPKPVATADGFIKISDSPLPAVEVLGRASPVKLATLPAVHQVEVDPTLPKRHGAKFDDPKIDNDSPTPPKFPLPNLAKPVTSETHLKFPEAVKQSSLAATQKESTFTGSIKGKYFL